MKKRTPSWVYWILILSMSSIAIGFGLYRYNRNLEDYFSRSTSNALTEIAEQQKFNFNSEIAAEINAVESLAISLQYLPEIGEEIPAQALQMMRKTKFEYLTIADLSGRGIAGEGNRMDFSAQSYFQKARSGETVISAPVQCQSHNQSLISLATPIYDDTGIKSVLIASYSADKLKDLILPSYSGYGYAIIVDKQGEIIMRTQNEFALTKESNLFEFFGQVAFYEENNLSEILQNVKAGKSGRTSYGLGESIRYAHYEPLNYNGWYIFVMVPQSVVAENVDNIAAQTTLLTYGIFALVILTVFLLSFLYTRAQRVEKNHLAQLERIAYYDELTGAPTLTKFKLDAQKILDENPSTAYLIIKLDVDQFKLVNQLYSYEVGNKLLCSVVSGIKDALPSEGGIYTRMNIDEFIIFHKLLPCERLGQNREIFLRTIHLLMGEQFQFSLKIPTGRYTIAANQGSRDISAILEKVNFAHRYSKMAQCGVFDYNESLAQNALQQKEIESRMGNALTNGEFQLFLQPKYDLENEVIAGAEALVRWKNADETFTNPDSFIPLFEKNGFITKLDFYMFEKACQTMNQWIAQGIAPVVISVNFSRLHLSNPNFVNMLCELADRYQTPHELLEIEITESTMFNNEDSLLQVLKQLHQAGFTLSMDDFGSGYSSLGLLKNIPIDVIKIDRSFFMNANDIQRAKIIIAIVMKMAHELGIHTVAEGVENREQVELLRKLGCDMVQGYYYAKPMPEAEFTMRFGAK